MLLLLEEEMVILYIEEQCTLMVPILEKEEKQKMIEVHDMEAR